MREWLGRIVNLVGWSALLACGTIAAPQVVLRADEADRTASSRPTNQGAPSQTLTSTRDLLIHRRFIRLPAGLSGESPNVRLAVGEESLPELDALLADALAAGGEASTIEMDVRPWLGAVIQFSVTLQAADGAAGEQFLGRITQSNRSLTQTAQPAPDTPERAAEDKRVSFAHQIKPILTENCFACHGPDDENEHSSLKLSDRDIAVQLGALKPGDAASSQLITRITSDDPDVLMPPPESHKQPLTAEQVALLRQWINEGAKYEKHWSFVPPTISQPTLASKAARIRSPIDAYVFSKLEAKGLKPNLDQQPHRLIRRLAFDITGLPPTADQVERYEANPTDEIYAELVEEFLSSPHYGEHWTRHWLDAVRYADTHGIHNDNYRSIWPYRDWVIGALNANMPFDQFTIEQMAGDMLPSATHSQRIASGYNRCLPTTGEGGSIVEEVAANNANDRTSATFAIWQGLTVGCAACHDHKFDPISQKEYYQLTAFFRNNTMNPLDGNAAAHPPVIQAPSAEQSAKRQQLQSQQAELAKQISHEEQVWSKAIATTPLQEKWRQLHSAALSASPDEPDAAKQPRFAVTPNASHSPHAAVVEGLFGPVAEVSGEHPIGFASPVQLDIKKGFAFGGFINCTEQARGALWSHRYSDPKSRGWEVTLDENTFRVLLADQQTDAHLALEVESDLTDGKWHHLFLLFDPKQPKQPVTIFVDGQPAQATASGTSPEALSPNTSLASDAKLYFGRLDQKQAGQTQQLIDTVRIEDFRYFDRVVTALEVIALRLEKAHLAVGGGNAGTPESDERQLVNVDNNESKAGPEFDVDALPELRRHLIAERYAQLVPPRLVELRAKRAGADAELATLEKEIPVTLVMVEKPNSTPTAHILVRGDYAAVGEQVTADVPATLPPIAPYASKDRLGLAIWLASPDNPLTARVVANRYWHHLFGMGIVETTEDFGATGSLPTHPKLLDWLAADFLNHDWDLKHLVRTIVLSSTYRQAQVVTPEKLQRDPENRWLSRGPRVRLDGEQLRDMALSNSGLLTDKLGGPPVKPYQPVDVWKDVAMPSSNTRIYKRDTGEALYRRSLYTFWKRSAAPPSMTILNAPPRDVFCVRRERTNTPLQAFVLLNDPQFVEAARHVAQRAQQASGGDVNAAANFVGQMFLSRNFSKHELEILSKTLAQAAKHFQATPEKAQELLAIGESPYDKSLDPVNLAAWTLVTSQIMNLDEAVTK